MKNSKSNILPSSLLFLALLLSFSLSNVNPDSSLAHELTPVKAATPMPANVNVTNLVDKEVNTYYQSVSGLKGSALQDALYNIIKGHNEYDYDNNTHRFIYKIIDRNWTLSPLTVANGYVNNFNYSADTPFITKFYGSYNNNESKAYRFYDSKISGRVSFDKEHIWAQSLGNFGRKYGAGSDFHMLVPSDINGNQSGHSNYSFGIPITSRQAVYGDDGSLVGYNGYISSGGNKVFEPLDEYKGDVARMMFYMPVRYNVYEDVLHPKLEIVNYSPNTHTATASVTGKAGILNTLLTWNEQDPVSDYEIKRNNLIYNNYQLNRNPFIDHPEWARLIFDTNYKGPGASVKNGSSSVGDRPAWQFGIDEETALISISLDTSNVKTSYVQGENFTSSGLIVKTLYDDESERIVTSYTLNISENTLLDEVGEKTVTITYTENDITVISSYLITVILAQTGNSVDAETIIYAAISAVALISTGLIVFFSKRKIRLK